MAKDSIGNVMLKLGLTQYGHWTHYKNYPSELISIYIML